MSAYTAATLGSRFTYRGLPPTQSTHHIRTTPHKLCVALRFESLLAVRKTLPNISLFGASRTAGHLVFPAISYFPQPHTCAAFMPHARAHTQRHTHTRTHTSPTRKANTKGRAPTRAPGTGAQKPTKDKRHLGASWRPGPLLQKIGKLSGPTEGGRARSKPTRTRRPRDRVRE